MVLYECLRCGYSSNNKSYFRKHLLRKKSCKIVLQNISIHDMYQELLGEPHPEAKMLQNNMPASTFCQHLQPERQRFVNTSPCNITNGENKLKKCYEKSELPVNLQSTTSDVTKQRQRFVNTSVCNIKKGENKLKKCYEKSELPINLQNDKNNVTKQRQHFVNTRVNSGENTYNKCYEKTELPVNLQNGEDNITKQSQHFVNTNVNSAEIKGNECYENSTIPDNLHKEDSEIIKEEENYDTNQLDLGEIKGNDKYTEKISASNMLINGKLDKSSPYNYKYYTDKGVYISHSDNISNELHDESNDDENDMLYECSYCTRSFTHRQGRHRHEKKCNSRKVLENRCTRLELILEQKEDAINQLRQQLEKLFDKVGSGEVHNHNTTNYTYNIILNAFGAENTSYINDSAVREVLQQGTMASIPKLLELIHFHPEHEENHNVRITNKKENTANIWDGDKWVLKRRPDAIEEMSDKAFNLINEHYEEGSNTKMDSFKNKYDANDRDMKKRVHQETELMIINNKKH